MSIVLVIAGALMVVVAKEENVKTFGVLLILSGMVAGCFGYATEPPTYR